MTGVSLAILSELNRSHFGLILDVQREISAACRNDEGLVVLNIVQSDNLCNGHIESTSLERHALQLPILNPVGEDLSRLGANQQYGGISVKGGSCHKFTRSLKLVCHLDFKPARVKVEAVSATS